MPDNPLPSDEQLEAAAAVLVRMGGRAINQALRYLARCTDQEIAALATCQDGRGFREILDQVSDRHIAEEAAVAEAAVESDQATPVDPAPAEVESPADDE